MSEKVLFSTDIGSDVDDALALLAAINAGINLQAVYTVNGDVKSRAFISKHLIDLSGRQIDVAVGESKPLNPLVEPYSFFEDCYVDDKFVDRESEVRTTDVLFKQPESVGIIQNGVKDLARRLSQEPHVIFNTAPMTNIAKVITDYPHLIENIKSLYIMGCRFEDGAQEHNVRFDVDAAKRVLDSDIPIVIVPGDVCTYKMPVSHLESLKSSPAGQYVFRMARGQLGAKTASRLSATQRDNSFSLAEFIKKEMKPHPKMKIEFFQADKMLGLKNRLLTNLADPYFGAFEPEKYFEQYQQLIEHLRDSQWGYEEGDQIAKTLESLVAATLHVSDAHVPYCFSNPDKVVTQRTSVQVDSIGRSYKNKGEKHQVVTCVDSSDFRRFLRKNLK